MMALTHLCSKFSPTCAQRKAKAALRRNLAAPSLRSSHCVQSQSVRTLLWLLHGVPLCLLVRKYILAVVSFKHMRQSFRVKFDGYSPAAINATASNT
jgi:hypothetical protein